MAPDELINLCKEAIDRHNPNLSDFPFVRLVLTGSVNGRRKKLCKMPGAPMGEILSVVGSGVLCIFDANKVLSFCENNIENSPQ